MDKLHNDLIATANFEWCEEYFSQFVSIAGNKKLIPMASFRSYLVLCFGIGMIYVLETVSVCLGIFFCLLSIRMFCRIYKSWSAPAVYKSCKRLHGLAVKYEFYDQALVITDKYGVQTQPYELLWNVKSSKHGYVLLDSKTSGYFIPRKECSESITNLIENIKSNINTTK